VADGAVEQRHARDEQQRDRVAVDRAVGGERGEQPAEETLQYEGHERPQAEVLERLGQPG